MPGEPTRYQALARLAAARVERAQAAGEQLTFLGDEVARPGQRDPDAPKRGPGKAMSQMREWLASRGYRLPEEVLVQMAGLDAGTDALAAAIGKTEAILLWAADGTDSTPTMAQRLATLQQVLAVQLRAAEALMPYGAPKATPDVQVNQRVAIVMPGAQAAAGPGERARDVTPGARRMAPPPMPGEIEQKQELSGADRPRSDGEDRTE